MAIERNVKVVIAGENAKLEESIYVYRHDRGVDLTFDILQNKFSFTGQQSENIVRNNEIMYAGLTIKKPSGEGFFRPILPIVENKVIFRIEHEHTDDFDEIGMYTLQIHLYDKFDNRISIPPFKLEVKPLIIDGINEIDGKTARADEAIVDVSVVGEDKELFIIEYTDGQGYVKTEWKAGEVITASRLNNLESGIENAFKALEELEIPSLEGLATEDFVNAQIALSKEELEALLESNKTELEDLVGTTKEDLEEKIESAKEELQQAIGNIEIPSIEGLASEEFVEEKVNSAKEDLEGQIQSVREEFEQAVGDIEIPSIEGLASEEFVGQAIAQATEPLASKEYVDEQIANIDIPEVDLSHLATKDEVQEAIDSIEIPSTDGLATEDYVNQTVNDATKGLASEAYVDHYVDKKIGDIEFPEPDLSNYYEKQETMSKEEILEALDNVSVDLSDYATLEYLRDVLRDYVTMEDVEENFATKENLISEISRVMTNIQSTYYNKIQIDSKFEDVDNQIGSIDNTIGKIGTDIEGINANIEGLDTKIDGVIESTNTEIEATKALIQEIKDYVDNIEFPNVDDFIMKNEIDEFTSHLATKEELEAKFNTIGIVGESVMPACYATAPEPEDPERDAVLWIQNRYGYNFVVHVPGYKNAKPFSSYISVSGSASFDSAYIKNDRYSISYVYRWDGSQWASHSESSFHLVPVRNHNDTIAYAKEKLLFHCTEDILNNGTHGVKYFDKVDKPTDIVYGDYNGAVTEGKYIVNHEVAIENCPQDYAKGILQVKVTKNEKLGTTEIFQEVSLLDGKTYKRAKDKANVWTEWSMSGGIDLGSLATREELHQAIADIDFPETDLSNYYNKQEADEATTNIVNTTLENYYTKDEVMTKEEVETTIEDSLAEYVSKEDLEELLENGGAGGVGIVGSFVAGSGKSYIPASMTDLLLPEDSGFKNKDVKHTLIQQTYVDNSSSSSSYLYFMKTFFFVDLEDASDGKYAYQDGSFIYLTKLTYGTDYVQMKASSATSSKPTEVISTFNKYDSSTKFGYNELIYSYDFTIFDKTGSTVAYENPRKTPKGALSDFDEATKDGYYTLDMSYEGFSNLYNSPKINPTVNVKGYLEVVNGTQVLKLTDGQTFTREINGAWSDITGNSLKTKTVGKISSESGGATPQLFKNMCDYTRPLSPNTRYTILYRQSENIYVKLTLPVAHTNPIKAYYDNGSYLNFDNTYSFQWERYDASTNTYTVYDNASGKYLGGVDKKYFEVYATDIPIYFDSAYTNLYMNPTPVNYDAEEVINNFNNATNAGVYEVVDGNVSNSPSSTVKGMLDVKQSGTEVYQELITSDNVSRYTRVLKDKNWSDWTKISDDFVGSIGVSLKFSTDKNKAFDNVPPAPKKVGCNYIGKILYSYKDNSSIYYRCAYMYTEPFTNKEPVIYATTVTGSYGEGINISGGNFNSSNSVLYIKNGVNSSWSESTGFTNFTDSYGTHIYDNTVPIYTDINKGGIYRPARTGDMINNLDNCKKAGKYYVNLTEKEFSEIQNMPNIKINGKLETILHVTVDEGRILQEMIIEGISYSRVLGEKWNGVSDSFVKDDIVAEIKGVDEVSSLNNNVSVINEDEIFDACPNGSSHQTPTGTIDFTDNNGYYYRWIVYGKNAGFYFYNPSGTKYMGVFAYSGIYVERWRYYNGTWSEITSTSNPYTTSMSKIPTIFRCDIDVYSATGSSSPNRNEIYRKADTKETTNTIHNFNKATTKGVYKVTIENSVAENSPIDSDILGFMRVEKFDNIIKQVLTTTEGTVYTRVSNGEMWSEWTSSKAQGSVGEGSGESVDLSNYYTKSETYNKNEVDELIENIDVPDVNLDNYYTKGQVDELIDSIEIPEGSGESVDLSDYHTKEEIRLLNNKNTFYDDNYNILIGNETTPIKLTELNKLRPNPSYKAVGMYIDGVAHLAFYLYPAMRAPMYYVSGSTYKLRIQYSDNKSYLYKLVDKVWQEVEIPEKAIYDLTLPGVIKMSDIFVAETGIVDNLSAIYGAKPLFDSTVYSYNLISNNGFYRVENGGSSYFPEPNGILEVVSSIDFRRYTFYTQKKTYIRYAYTNRDTNGQNNGGWKEVDNTSYDITKYYTKTEVDKAISNIDIPEVDLSNYPTIEETSSAIQEAINAIPPTDLSSYSTTDETVELINNLVGIPRTSLIEQTNRLIGMLKGEK